jgi:hypothetical protein
MNKKLIRLTESDLHRIVRGSVQKLLREWKETEDDVLSRLQTNYDGADENEKRELYNDLYKKRIAKAASEIKRILDSIYIPEEEQFKEGGWYDEIQTALFDMKEYGRTRNEVSKDDYFTDLETAESPRMF